MNGFLDYTDDQDRLTRTSLSGVRLFVGLINYNPEDIVLLSLRRGVTTDGDLVALQNPSETDAGMKDSTLKSIDIHLRPFVFQKFSDDKANISIL